MWRVHRLDHIYAKKPANPFDFKSLNASISEQKDWPVFLRYTSKCRSSAAMLRKSRNAASRTSIAVRKLSIWRKTARLIQPGSSICSPGHTAIHEAQVSDSLAPHLYQCRTPCRRSISLEPLRRFHLNAPMTLDIRSIPAFYKWKVRCAQSR